MQRPGLFLLSFGFAFLFFGPGQKLASAQPNAGMMQAVQSNLDSQRTIAAAQQASYRQPAFPVKRGARAMQSGREKVTSFAEVW